MSNGTRIDWNIPTICSQKNWASERMPAKPLPVYARLMLWSCKAFCIQTRQSDSLRSVLCLLKRSNFQTYASKCLNIPALLEDSGSGILVLYWAAICEYSAMEAMTPHSRDKIHRLSCALYHYKLYCFFVSSRLSEYGPCHKHMVGLAGSEHG